MPAGRPPKPTALKLLQGTARPDRVNANEPKPGMGNIKPPAWLKGEGRKAWRWLAPALQEMNILTNADPHALALLCDAYAEYLAARAVIRDEGMTYTTFSTSGSKMVRARPEVAIAADAWRRVNQMMQQFGLTPSSRAKVSAAPEEAVDPFAEWERGSQRASS
ncbi:MAG TPA: phage terminase small subunit P27 family [Thermomicrobiaceae bacterium]|nr:phage terminase small subunit P27 family [Thermomicrobiaceae bacterium]